MIIFAALGVVAQGQEEPPDSTPPPVVVKAASDSDLGFDLMHMEIVADGRIPSQGTDYSYRVLSVSDQGDCRDLCPATLVYVVLGEVSAKRGEEMKAYRIDGIRFMHFPKVTVLDPDANAGFFLALRFTSMPHPRMIEHYVARVGPQGAIVERDGPDRPAPAHRFEQIFHRPGAGVFRLKLANGNIFRLKEFEIFDPETYGQADAWLATVVESPPSNPPAYQMKPGTYFGPFLESDITEIYDEALNEAVLTRPE
jgi:hypothetical protein